MRLSSTILLRWKALSNRPAEVLQLLVELRRSTPEAEDKLVPVVYGGLRHIADEEFRGTSAGAHLPVTSALKLAYFRVTGEQSLSSVNLRHFFLLGAQLVRHLLVVQARSDHAQSQPRGDKTVTVVTLARAFSHLQPWQLLSLDEALLQLSELDPGACQLVELCFFAGLSMEDASHVLAVPVDQAQQDWRLAKAWIYQQGSAARTATATTDGTSRKQMMSGMGRDVTKVAESLAQDRGTTLWTPQHWQLAKNAFNQAVVHPGKLDRGWLRGLCGADLSLENDVALLLSSDQRAPNFLEVPTRTLGGPLLKGPHSLGTGETISGRFKIIRFISSGGMGEVYEAWDYELQDKVALKTVRPEVSSIPAVIESFKQEVRRARGISHPSICRVYDLFRHNTVSGERIWFLTMQLLQGETLLDRVRRAGPFKPEEALPLIEQMVDAIAAAHRLEIVHRDLKSGNVMLVEDESGHERAVITDFGLAIDLSSASRMGWEPGGQGTPDYMAPEQRRDGRVGFAADQYALGVVMCEMVTGRRPTRRIRAVAGKVDVDLPSNHDLPPAWEPVLRRCLRTKPEERYPDIRDVAVALNPRRRRARIAAVSAVVLLMLILLVGIYFPGKPKIEAARALTSETDFSAEPSISRDGKTLAYTSDRAEGGNLDIWVQHLAGEPMRITTDSAEDRNPSLAPDGSSVVWRSSRNGGAIYISNLAGNGSERLLVPGGRNPTFSPDGHKIAFWLGDTDKTVASGQLYLLSLPNGSPIRLASDFKDARLPAWSSDGQYILFMGCHESTEAMPACSEWWVTRADGSEVRNTGAMALLRDSHIVLIEGLGGWSGDNVVFAGRRGLGGSAGESRELWELSLPQANPRAGGRLRQLTNSGDIDGSSSVAQDGTILFSRFAGALHVWRISPASHPDAATAAKVTHDPAIDISPYISHNGRWLVFSRGVGNHHDVWTKDMQSGKESVFVASANNTSSPIIDEAGETVVYETSERDTPSIFRMERGARSTLLCTGCSKPTGWFDGNSAVLYREGLPSKIKMVNPSTGQSAVVLKAPNVSLGEATWSPENQYLLFTVASEGGRKQAFAVAFPRTTRVATGKWIPITGPSEWSDRPRWSGDGKTLFYLSDRDGFSCLWGQHFDPVAGQTVGPPFAVMHYHNARLSPEEVIGDSFQVSVSGDSIYLNVAEMRDTIWAGVLKQRRFFFNWRR